MRQHSTGFISVSLMVMASSAYPRSDCTCSSASRFDQTQCEGRLQMHHGEEI